MKPEVIRPRRWSPSHLLVAVIIAYTGWSLTQVLEGLERERAAEVVRGPACTSTVYYEPCPTGVWCYGQGGLSGWCRP